MNRIMKTRIEAYKDAVRVLQQAGIQDAATDALRLMEKFCHCGRNDLYVHEKVALSPEEERMLEQALAKREQHIPVQYITEEQEFMGLPFYVNESVLIPRQDTEILVEEVLKYLSDGMEILDLCTGSGCILLSLLASNQKCHGIGGDISGAALQVAKRNMEQQKVLNAVWIESNLFEKVNSQFNIIVSNPPYIKSSVIETLMPEVKDYEPVLALDGKEDGCYFYEKICRDAPRFLKPGGMLFFEIGYDEADTVRVMMQESGLKEITVKKDYSGLDRVIYGHI